jgi:hypothetical protein
MGGWDDRQQIDDKSAGRGWVGPIVAVGSVVLVAAVVGVAVVRYGQPGRSAVDEAPTAPTADPVATAAEPPSSTEPVGAVDASGTLIGELAWVEAAPGLETAELVVRLDGTDVDRMLLSRLDPSRFRFQVLSRPEGDRDIDEWLDATGASLAVNGSLFDPAGRPVAPALSGGEPLGPRSYDATHGAFVAATADGDETAGVVDLRDTTWQEALAGAHDAMVSYPMLIGDDGASRTDHVDTGQLTERTFIAEDGAGRIVIGTTSGDFFSLDRLGPFLAAIPLDLVTALNLDGGPLACQALRVDDLRRESCGQTGAGGRPGLPIVLVALPV